jgi:hypothetical protein
MSASQARQLTRARSGAHQLQRARREIWGAPLSGVAAVAGALLALLLFLGSSAYVIYTVARPAGSETSSSTYFFSHSFSISLRNSEPTIVSASSPPATGFSVRARAGRITLAPGQDFAVSAPNGDWTIRGCSRITPRRVVRKAILVGPSDALCLQDSRSKIASVVALRYVAYARVRLQIFAARLAPAQHPRG